MKFVKSVQSVDKRFLIILSLAAGLLLALAYVLPLAVPYYQDFSVMYFTDSALLHGIPIYAYPAQLAFVRPQTPAGFEFLPYPYPPWYALATLFIGLLPIQAAARLWFFANLVMFSLAAWGLTRHWKAPWRILSAPAAILFIPAFGLLMVGQYSAPILLGAVLFVLAARAQRSFWMAAGLLLLTLKPHIGFLLFLAGFGWLLWQKTAATRRAAWTSLLGGLLLAAAGFLADPAWPLTYLGSLARYRDLPGVDSCGLCASLSVTLIRLAFGQSSLLLAAGLSAGLALLAGGLIWARYRMYMKDAGFLMAVAASLTLLIDPYLLNYDYVLLLLPLFWLARPGRLTWLVLPVYLLPWLLLFLGREANGLLSIAGIVTFILVLLNPIDAPMGEAYNQ